jgi:hypothetical protein
VTVQYEAPAAARAFGANACTEAKVNEFLKTCIEGDNATNCNAWLKANGACATCLATPPDKAPTGAFLLDASGQNRPWPNQEGCLSNVQPGCGPKWGSFIACEYTACPKAACEAEPASTIDKCFSDAVTGPCASQLQATKTACSTALPENKQGPGAVCITLQTEGDFRAFAMKFCGP